MTPISLFRPKGSRRAASPRKNFGRAAACLIATVLATSAFAQAIPNIAGTYRGLMTRCLSSAQATDCRQGLTGIIKLADEVDAKQAVWSQAAAGDDRARTDRLHRDYSSALDQLNRSIDEFNRSMGSVTSEPGQR